MAAAANKVQVVKGEGEWLQGGGGEVSEEKLAFRRAMATRVEKMQFDSSLVKPLAMQERIPNSQQQQQQQQLPKLPQQQQQQQQILFQWQQPIPPAFYAGGAATAAAEAWRSRSVVANGAALNQQKGKDGLVLALGQQQQGIVFDPQVVSGMIVPPTTTTTMTTSSAPVAPTTGLKKKIACTVLPKGMPIRPLPLHGYIDPFSRPMTTSSTVRLHHHHQHYHGVTTTSSTTTASGAPHEQVVQQVQQSFVQGNKRYKECMDYAHLGCRHFVPCNDPPDPAGGAAEQQQMLKRQQGVVSNPVLMGRKTSPPASAGNWKETPLARGIGVKLEPGRSFLGHFHIDPQQRSMAQVVRVGSNNSLSCCRKSKVEFDDEQQQQAKQSVGGGGASSSVSQVTTAAAVSCVESAESDNNGAMVENLCNASSSPAGGDGDGVDCAAAARSDQMNKDAGTKEEDEEPSPEVISAAEALDVLAHAAISWGDDGCAELGSTSRKAVFVHGEIPFVQKRVRRCSRPSRVLSQLGTAKAKAAAAVQARSVPAVPERFSQRHPSRKRSVDDYEYDDLGPEAKKPRKNEQPASSSKPKPKPKPKPKKKSAPKRKKPATKTKTKIKPECDDEDGDGGDDDEVVVVSSLKRKSWTTSSATPKRKKLNAVVKRSEEEARQQQQQQHEEDDDDVEDDEDEQTEIDEHLAAAMEIQEAEEVLGALVRSKRGRNQNLPVRFQGTVMGSWKKGNRKLKPKL